MTINDALTHDIGEDIYRLDRNTAVSISDFSGDIEP